jgi:predicted amidohydrolase YtcJ
MTPLGSTVATTRVLYRGGRIRTPDRPDATAIMTVGSQVGWVGTDAEVAGADVDDIVELDGDLVTAAFVDAHSHLTQTGLALQTLDLSRVRSRQDILEALGGSTAGPPAVVLGHGWDETAWSDPSLPTRHEIDRVVGHRAAYLTRVDSHSALVSSALVEAAPDVVGAVGWSSDGPLTRDAHHRVRTTVQTVLPRSVRAEAAHAALRQAAQCGIGFVHDLQAPHISAPDEAELVAAAAAEPRTPEVVTYWGALAPAVDAPEETLGLAGDLCIDGSIGSRTAALNDPYADADTRGYQYLDVDEITEHVVFCTRAGQQAGFHVIGDAAHDAVLAGFRRAAVTVGRDALIARRHRLEHVEMIDEADIATLAEYGIVASVQPAFDAAWGGPDDLYARRLGTDRAQRMNPYARMHRAGVVLAFGSDTPVTPFDPWGGVRAAMMHHTADQQLTGGSAFDAHTRGGYRATGDDSRGVLAAGHPATLSIWHVPAGLVDDGGPFPVLAADAPAPSCRRTVVNGCTIFDEEDAS